MFETQDFLYSEEAGKVSTKEQRTAMLDTLSQASEWMFEEGDGQRPRWVRAWVAMTTLS